MDYPEDPPYRGAGMIGSQPAAIAPCAGMIGSQRLPLLPALVCWQRCRDFLHDGRGPAHHALALFVSWDTGWELRGLNLGHGRSLD